MVDTCVCCGAIVPEGTHVCYACSHDSIRCPDCGTELRFMHLGQFCTVNQILYSRLYHCEGCHADWEVDSLADTVATELKRKFWG